MSHEDPVLVVQHEVPSARELPQAGGDLDRFGIEQPDKRLDVGRPSVRRERLVDQEPEIFKIQLTGHSVMPLGSRAGSWTTSSTGSGTLREAGLLDQPTGSMEGPPDADLPAPIEVPGPHDGAVLAEPLPGAVQCAVDPVAGVSTPGVRSTRRLTERRLRQVDGPGATDRKAGRKDRLSRVINMEPTLGFEPRTCCLRNSCSTAELCRRDGSLAAYLAHVSHRAWALSMWGRPPQPRRLEMSQSFV